MAATIPGAGITTPLTLTEDGNLDTLTLKSTDTDANSAPILNLFRDANSAADNDFVGSIKFNADNDANEETQIYEIKAGINDASDGTEDGMVRHSIMVGGTLSDVMTLDSTIVVFNDASNDINFRVESNNVTHALFVDAGNDCIGIGTSSPSPFRFHVDADASNNGIAKFNHSDSTPEGIRIIFSAAAPDNTSATFLECTDSSDTRLQIQAQGNVQNHDNNYGQISDERIKDNIVDANSQWDDIKALKVRNFERKDDIAKYGEGKKVQIGLIAQECETVSPGLVNEQDPSPGDIRVASEFGTLYEDGDTIPEGKEIGDIKEVKEQVKAISYSVLYMKAIKALQEAMAKIETLETKVKALEEA